MNNFSTTNSTAPGIPKTPTKIAVAIFKPIWKPKVLPTKLMKKIRIPPKIEFTINFIIAFKGMEKTFPTIHKTIIHAKIVKPLEKSKFYHHSFISL